MPLIDDENSLAEEVRLTVNPPVTEPESEILLEVKLSEKLADKAVREPNYEIYSIKI